ncbi:MAG: hypothetical protein RLZZ337_638 [Bacteroidota bacterium]
MKHICLMRILLIVLVCFYSVFGWSQDKLLTINDAIVGYHLYPRGANQLQFLPSGKHVSQVKVEDGNQMLTIESIDGKSEAITVSLEDVNANFEEDKKLKRLPYPNWISDTEFQFANDKEQWAYNINSKKARMLYWMVEPASEVIYANNGKGYVGVIKNGIGYEIDGVGGDITSDKEGIVLGQSVHRNEFGINNGLFLSPNNQLLAYYEMDESMVTEYPLYQLADTPAKAKMLRYPTAGKASHHVLVKVLKLDGLSSSVTLNTGLPKEQYLTNVAWTPDSKYILIAIVNRAQNHMWLNKYDATTGAFIKTLFEEKNEKYVEPEHPAVFLKTDPTKFIWWSERDGYNHLYLYDLEGNLIRQITKGKYVVTELHGFSGDGKNVFISSTEESPLDRHLYCVSLANGKSKRLTKESGYHRISANADCSYFIDDFSSTSVPRIIQLLDAEGKASTVYAKADNPLAEYKLGEMELGTLKGKSGDDLYYRVFKPIDFDPSKKYPVVFYLYNGPHLQLNTNRWLGGANLWYQYMAQNGFVVFSIDGRGSADRGFAFESAIHRNCAEKEMEDQLTGLDWLKAQKWVDADRIGIHGWSYGGFMTTSLMTRKPGIFKVGVAGGPVIDWSLYEVMYTERYMDTPEENPEGYKATDLKNYVQDLDGKLLMIHGGQDNVVLWQHSLQYLNAAIAKGVQIDYFVYPDHEHNVLGKDRVHLYEKVSKYFFDNL